VSLQDPLSLSKEIDLPALSFQQLHTDTGHSYVGSSYLLIGGLLQDKLISATRVSLARLYLPTLIGSPAAIAVVLPKPILLDRNYGYVHVSW
jgi:hypothetical protein